MKPLTTSISLILILIPFVLLVAFWFIWFMKRREKHIAEFELNYHILSLKVKNWTEYSDDAFNTFVDEFKALYNGPYCDEEPVDVLWAELISKADYLELKPKQER